MNWEKVKLGDVCDSCLGKMLDKVKNKGELRPYLANLNVRWGEFETSNLLKMKFEDHELERYGIKYGDLIMCEGGEIGRCAIWKEEVPNMMIQKALHRIRPKDSRLNIFYLLYWFIYQGQIGAIDQYASGTTTIKHLPAIKLKQIEIDLPPRPVQDKIASILSAYDDMIDNCKKQIALLEEAAQRLYREWFVDLRFPGHESTPIGENGLPKGWQIKSISSVCKYIASGSTPSRKQVSYWENASISWFKTKELLDGWLFDSEEHISDEAKNRTSVKIFPANSILIAIYASPTLGRLGILTNEATFNQAALGFIVNDDEISMEFLFLKLRDLRDEFNQVARGAGQQNISGEIVKQWQIVVPAKTVIDSFTDFVKPYFTQWHNASSILMFLKKSKEILLPRLISGQIELNA